MSAERRNLRGDDRHAHLAPEDAVLLALEQTTGRVQTDSTSAQAHARARACPECARVLDAALEDLLHVRSAMVALPKVDARRAATLAEATIGLTTRKDLSWRGDGRVVGRFLRESWRSSLAVRVVSVSLCLSLIAWPVIAIVLALRVNSPQSFSVALAPPATELPTPHVAIEPRHELVREPEPETLASLTYSLDMAGRSDRLELARHDLLEAGASKLFAFQRQIGSNDDLDASVARMMIVNNPRLGVRPLDAVVAETSTDPGLVERARCADRLVDHWVSSGQVDPRLSAALWQLSKRDDAASGSLRADTERERHGQESLVPDGLELAGPSSDLAPHKGINNELLDAVAQACASTLAVEPSGPLAGWLAYGRGRAR